jgi:hypothetical protein
VFSATGGEDLFTLDSVLSMCHIEAEMIASEEYHSICESISFGKCCHGWSLGNYIALLHNRSSCFEVTVSVGRSTIISDIICKTVIIIYNWWLTIDIYAFFYANCMK